jgi:hypothetical protein
MPHKILLARCSNQGKGPLCSAQDWRSCCRELSGVLLGLPALVALVTEQSFLVQARLFLGAHDV